MAMRELRWTRMINYLFVRLRASRARAKARSSLRSLRSALLHVLTHYTHTRRLLY